MTLSLKLASDAETLATLNVGREPAGNSGSILKRAQASSFLKRNGAASTSFRSPAVPSSTQQTMVAGAQLMDDGLDARRSQLPPLPSNSTAFSSTGSDPAGIAMTLDAFASSLAMEDLPAVQPIFGVPASGQQPPPSAAEPTEAAFEAADGPSPARPASASSWQEAAGGGGGLLFEVELWRADLLTSVLELDNKGSLLGGGLINPLCPPGRLNTVRGNGG